VVQAAWVWEAAGGWSMVRVLDRLEIKLMRDGAAAAGREDWIAAHEAYAQAVGAQLVWHDVVARRERPGKIDRDQILATKLAEARTMLVQKCGHTFAPSDPV
jgi:hypothetical protein